MSYPFVGEIRMFAFGRLPNGWLACDGSLKSTAEYDILFNLLGTTFGGDGNNTFGVPDLRGRVPIHQGRGGGLGTYVMGQMGGSEQVTLNPTQMPAHAPPLMATTALATTGTVGTGVVPAAVAGDSVFVKDISGASAALLAPNVIVSQGGNQPHENQMPTLTVQFCIAWSGVYPSPQ